MVRGSYCQQVIAFFWVFVAFQSGTPFKKSGSAPGSLTISGASHGLRIRFFNKSNPHYFPHYSWEGRVGG